MSDLLCRCRDRSRANPCIDDATQEDGLCDGCRHSRGACCEDCRGCALIGFQGFTTCRAAREFYNAMPVPRERAIVPVAP